MKDYLITAAFIILFATAVWGINKYIRNRKSKPYNGPNGPYKNPDLPKTTKDRPKK